MDMLFLCTQMNKSNFTHTSVEVTTSVGLQPSIITFNATISACGKGRQWQQAVGRSQQGRGVFVGVAQGDKTPLWEMHMPFLWLASQHKLNWRLAQALFLFKRLFQWQLTPTSVTYAATASAFEQVGEWERAILLLEHCHCQSMPANLLVYNACISACEKAARWTEALSLLEMASDQAVQDTRLVKEC